MRRRSVFLALSLFLAAIPAAPAADLANNLSETPQSTGGVNENAWQAQAFTTSLTNYVITSVTVAVHKDAGMAGNLDLYFWDNSGTGGKPGSSVSVNPIASVPAESLGTNVGDTYTWNLNYTLSPATTYYLALGASSIGVGGGNFWWDYTASTAGTGFPSRWANSSNSGVSWSSDEVLVEPMQMRITAVPEPSTWGLGLIGALTLAWSSRRSVRKLA